MLIATDGVFSMDGVIANLKGVCDLADKYDALVMVDDSHAVGFVGENGRGSHEYCEVMGRVDIITGTSVRRWAARPAAIPRRAKEVVEWLRQRSRPYLFSNSLARRSSPPPSKCWRWWSPAANCATACGPTRACSAKK
ncbi:2-amino-3-ketobutyrate coenzyme A ligase [Raoultella terrigena]|uniref:2-amino-3-ketobutyrate coenzyme A ligase n=1 Tax=Raoultella terrigena TaxID=577 RepID=A0A4U9D2H5_RAOTE|nr:2-amino-3-ketobutyrate coenzyme A ligase [Raoultella terrigena]